jgi:hypothetical protein
MKADERKRPMSDERLTHEEWLGCHRAALLAAEAQAHMFAAQVSDTIQVVWPGARLRETSVTFPVGHKAYYSARVTLAKDGKELKLWGRGDSRHAAVLNALNSYLDRNPQLRLPGVDPDEM